MKLPGFCTGCRKIKHVHVRPPNLESGLCDSCQEREDRQRANSEANRQLTIGDIHRRPNAP